MPLEFSAPDPRAIPLHAVTKADLIRWTDGLDEVSATWVRSSGFKASAGEVVVCPDQKGQIRLAAVGMGSDRDRRRGRFLFAGARERLPAGLYGLEGMSAGPDLEEAALGWLLAGYRFDRYVKPGRELPQLIAPGGIDGRRIELIAAGEALTRDLINTPASDMGPAELEAAARGLSAQFGGEITVIAGDDLAREFPLIHTVGRASDRAPRLIDLRWGDAGPSLALVGKGVCFDTGGLNIKPGNSMGLMKKDMGGAATVLGLARMIMALGLRLRLRVLIPAVENAISGSAFRPQDILVSRKGLSVEVNNTDAEGRLVLADALALADEEKPELVVSMATLTGAARVAVGPDLAPFYATSDEDAGAVSKAAQRVRDPVWRLPFWDPYEAMIEPGIADLDNAPKGGFAGSITAALFLRRFVTGTPRYLHFDIYGWQPNSEPGRPKGGVGQGARATLEALPEMLRI